MVDSESGLQLVIFDCDGVLVDSERIAHEVLVTALGELGLELDVDEAMRVFMGNTLPQTIARIERELGAVLPEDFVSAWRDRLYREFWRRPVRTVEGVEALLDDLPLPVCVVSNGPIAKMESTLGATGLLPRFAGKLFSPDCGLPGKPAPDLFVKAASDLRAEPRRTLVIEDSPTGVRGAAAAGMQVLGYAGAAYTDAAALVAEGARACYSMREVADLIAERI